MKRIETIGLNSSSSGDDDDDDIYVNAAARLRALKKKTVLVVEDDSPKVEKINNVIHTIQSPQTQPSCSASSRRMTRQLFNQQQREIHSEVAYLQRESNSDCELVIGDDSPEVLEESSNSLSCFNNSIDDDNYNIAVKIKWKSKGVVRLELRKHETFEKIFKHLAEMENLSEKHILILKNNRVIKKSDTPASINLQVIDILEGGILNNDVVMFEDQDDGNTCKIKVQMSTKQKITVNLGMKEKFTRVVLTCAEQLGVSASQIKLEFDGDPIASTDTPESLDLEQEACIDLRVV